jgi:hypothetical protein
MCSGEGWNGNEGVFFFDGGVLRCWLSHTDFFFAISHPFVMRAFMYAVVVEMRVMLFYGARLPLRISASLRGSAFSRRG